MPEFEAIGGSTTGRLVDVVSTYADVREAPLHALESSDDRWELLEWFMLAQWLCSVIIMLPGAQAVRLPMRILPYAGNIGLLFAYVERLPPWKRFPGTTSLVLVFALMLVEFLHPDTALIPGLVQVGLSTSIFAPAFWGGKAIRDKRRLDRILYLMFFFSASSALVGFLQAKYGLLMPAQFSSALGANKVESLTYVGANGQALVRPPGLSDLPGGAAGAAAFTVLLGTALAAGVQRLGAKSIVYGGVVALGTITLYLTQVRIMFISVVLGLLLTAWAVSRHSKVYGTRILLAGCALLAVGFVYAVAIGGKSVSDRFATLFSGDTAEVYQQNRGHFIQQTVETLLPEYPFGAGMGRWGMARVYAEPYLKETDPPSLWAEVQPTGWLLDGGFLMWVFYGSAILSSLLYAYRRATTYSDRDVCYFAGLIVMLNMIIILMVFDAPVFNTQLGAQFWLLGSGLAGVCETPPGRSLQC
jgi:hypothetical protein